MPGPLKDIKEMIGKTVVDAAMDITGDGEAFVVFSDKSYIVLMPQEGYFETKESLLGEFMGYKESRQFFLKNGLVSQTEVDEREKFEEAERARQKEQDKAYRRAEYEELKREFGD